MKERVKFVLEGKALEGRCWAAQLRGALPRVRDQPASGLRLARATPRTRAVPSANVVLWPPGLTPYRLAVTYRK